MENFSIRGGSSIVSSRLLFSDDARYLFCASGYNINVYSMNTEECCLTLKGHSDKVTSIVINPLNQLQILSSSLNGEIIKWDFSDNVLLKNFKLSCLAIHHLYAPIKMSKKIYAIVTVENHEVNFVKLSLEVSSCDVITEMKCLISNVNADYNCHDIGASGSFFAFVKGRNLHAYHLKNKSLIRHRVSKHNNISCMRCHPTELCVATGLNDGKIYIWRDLFPESDKSPIITIIHWHALTVRCLAFTPEGSYLLSGGYECVLLKWQLDTLSKETLPRLGAPIIDISTSTDGNFYALSHIDNGIQIITNTFKVTQTFQGLVKCHKDLQVKNLCPINLTLDPRTEAIVLNGGPGQLQFYDLKKNIQLFRLDVVGENYVSPEDLRNPLDMTEVLVADFDLKGDWLATVEGRSNDRQLNLKFWSFQKEIKSFSLNACISMPHEKAVKKLMFRKTFDWSKTKNNLTNDVTDNMCVTISKDHTFAVWRLSDTSDIYKSSAGWIQTRTGSFKNFVPTPIDFSFDGTILSVGFNSVLTIWDPNECSLISSEDFQLGDIRNIVFEKYLNSSKLLFSFDDYLASFSVLQNKVLWVIPLKVVSITTHQSLQEFSIFLQNETWDLQIFNTLKPICVKSYKNISKSRVLSSLQIENHLLYLNEDQDLLEFQSSESLKNKNEENFEIPHLGKLLVGRITEDGKMWNNILGNKRITEGKVEMGTDAVIIEMEKYNKIIGMPIYVMPSFESLCMGFLDCYMKKKVLKEIEDSGKVIIEDSDADSDNQMDIDDKNDNDSISDSSNLNFRI